jgi:nucleoside-diphosphate-sugar epimerase
VNGAFTRREFIGLKEREIRSFVYVQDVVAVVRALMERREDSTSAQQLWSPGAAGLVLNVGGPQGLSRLEVARRLCAAAGAQLVLSAPPGSAEATSEDSTGGSDICDWRVYVLDSAPPAPVTAGTNELVSPRDISMDCTDTERLLNMKFTAIDTSLLRQLCL